MRHRLPKEIDPFRLAKNGLILEGKLPLSGMTRLSEILDSTDGEVNVKMMFDFDKVLGTPVMRGRFTAALTLQCERCASSMMFDADVDCMLAILTNEKKAESLSEQYEPWVIDNDDPVILSHVVEDELILALPLIPKHMHDCLPGEAWSSGGKIEDNEEKVSPFAVLKALKKD